MVSTKANSIDFLCNGCFVEMTLFGETPPSTDGQPVKNSFITECFHVLCLQCRKKGDQQCVVCKKDTRYMAVSCRMPQRYRTYFNDLTKMQTKFEKVMSFQSGQSQLSGMKFVDKREQLKQKCADAEEMVNESKQKYQTTRDKKEQMKVICKIVHDENRKSRQATQRHQLNSRNRLPDKVKPFQMSPCSTQDGGYEDDNMTTLANFNPLEHDITIPATTAPSVVTFDSEYIAPL